MTAPRTSRPGSGAVACAVSDSPKPRPGPLDLLWRLRAWWLWPLASFLVLLALLVILVPESEVAVFVYSFM